MNTTHDGSISIRGLTRRFGDVVALHPTELEVAGGAVTGLLGPNGSGKSTLLRMLIGLVKPDAGAARLDGVELEGDGTRVRRRCTFAPGEIALYGEMRASEHLDWCLRGRDAEAGARARSMAEKLGLPLRARVHTFSHGMKRQLLFVSAMAPRVGVRILDEPSEGLDPNKRSAVLDLIAAEAAQGTTILLSSHHLGEVDRVCRRMVFLNKGRVIQSEHALDVRERAAKLLRIDFEPGSADKLEQALAGLAGARVKLRGEHAVFELEDQDPRAFLGTLFATRELPRPRSIEYGRISLQDLYADLYGVEAV